MKKAPRRWVIAAALVLGAIAVLVGIFALPRSRGVAADALNPERAPYIAYDVWGREISHADVAGLDPAAIATSMLAPSHGAVAVNDELLKLGREVFYREPFGSQVAATEITGLLDGPIGATDIAAAIVELKGGGTTNLRVRVSRPQTIAGRRFEKGELVETGLDVAKGSVTPLGFAIRPGPRGQRTGITCAACHSTVDPQTYRVINGAPNNDIRAGLLAAFAANSASFYAHADFEDIARFIKDPDRAVNTSDGGRAALPDPQAFEDAVDAALMKWPPGSFDSMIDLKGNPTQIPSSFTRGAHPYGWSGFALAGPFRGLSVLNNNVHGLNSDPFTAVDHTGELFKMDKEVYIAIVLQNAASPAFRFDPAKGDPPSEFLQSIDPTPGTPAFKGLVASPKYPRPSLLTPDGLFVSSPGRRMWEQINAVSAWQNSLVPPQAPIKVDAAAVSRGRAAFERAGCISCHSGPALTNNRIIPAEEIGTEPVRALAFQRLEGKFRDAVIYSFDQRVPVEDRSKVVRAPTDAMEPQQVNLAFGWGGTRGGYKVQSLVGLYWSAPYLHDGGVAVGPDLTRDVGVPNTWGKNIAPDPRNSLRAMIDRSLRGAVVAANESSADLRQMNVRGIGHEFWTDEAAGFSAEEQEALITWLLNYMPDWPE